MLAQKAWRMIRTLIFTYLVSGVLLTALAFALYKFRLPESQITLGISGVYILSCFMGGFMAGKAMRSRKFLWGSSQGSFTLPSSLSCPFSRTGPSPPTPSGWARSLPCAL